MENIINILLPIDFYSKKKNNCYYEEIFHIKKSNKKIKGNEIILILFL